MKHKPFYPTRPTRGPRKKKTEEQETRVLTIHQNLVGNLASQIEHPSKVKSDVIIYNPSQLGTTLVDGDVTGDTWEAWLADFIAAMPSKIGAPGKFVDPQAGGYGVVDFEYLFSGFVLLPEYCMWEGWRTAKTGDTSEAGFWTAVREICRQVMTTCRNLRPNVKWGFYNLPDNNYLLNCETQVPNAPYPALRAQWDAIAVNELPDLIDVVDVIYPSLYMGAGLPHAIIREWIYETCDVGGKWHRFFGYRKQVMPYLWFRTHNGTAGGGANHPDSLVSVVIQSLKDANVQDAVLWGYVDPAGTSVEDTRTALNDIWYPKLEDAAIAAPMVMRSRSKRRNV